MRRVRAVIALSTALVLVAALAAPAAAGGKPARFPAPADPFELPGGPDGVCDFPVRLETVVDRSYGLEFPPDADDSVRLMFTGYVLGRATNLDTGESVSLPVAAQVTISFGGDGTIEVAFAGPIWAYYFEADEPVSTLDRGLWHVRGHGGERYGEDGSLVEAWASGRITNVCALLAS